MYQYEIKSDKKRGVYNITVTTEHGKFVDKLELNHTAGNEERVKMILDKRYGSAGTILK